MDSLDCSGGEGEASKSHSINIELIVNDASGTPTTVKKKIMLTCKNPCIDTEFVNIIPPALNELEYEIGSGPLEDEHDEWTI